MAISSKRVEKLNEEFAFVIQGGHQRIVRFQNGKVGTIMTTEAFKTLVSNRYLGLPDLGSLWLRHPKRRTYLGATYDPSSSHDSTILNFWNGFAVKPIEGNCQIALDFIRDVICDGNKELFRYVLAWMSNLVREPGNKPGTSLVLRGGQGTGKSTFADMLVMMLGTGATVINSSRQLAGNFNAHVSQRVLVILEEGFIRTSDANAIKQIITGATLRCEPKGVDPFDVPNNLRLIICTNEGTAIHAQGDERRYCVLDISPLRKGDQGYFAQLRTWMKNGGVANLLDFLMKYDGSDVDLRVVPQTAALVDQKMASFDAIDRALYEFLLSGRIGSKIWSELIERSFLVEEVMHFEQGYSKKVSAVSVGMRLKEIFGDCQAARAGSGPRERFWRLPELSTARQIFASKKGIDGHFDEGVTSSPAKSSKRPDRPDQIKDS